MIYSVKLAVQSLLHEKWINMLSVLSIAMGLLVITVISLAIYNVNMFTKGLPEKFSVIAYLKEGLSEQEKQDIIASIKSNKTVEQTKYISKEDALKELKSLLRDADYILEGLGENPLPASIEVRVRKDAMGLDSVKLLASEIKKINGVDDIQYGERFLITIQSIKVGVETMGLILAIILTAGVTFICYSTVKILFYRKKEEIETLKLIGATSGFIRTPFVIEGGVIGMAGGIIAMAAIFTFYFGVVYRLGMTVPVLRSIAFPPSMILITPLTGLALGIAGALIAIGRIRY